MRYLVLALAAAIACPAGAQSARKRAAPSAAALPPAAAAPATPAAPAERVWDKEPNAFLGIRLGEPLGGQTCPTKVTGQYVRTEYLDYEAMKSLPGVCLDLTDERYKASTSIRKLGHLPDLGIGYLVLVHLKDGVVSKITIDLKQSAFPVLLAAFKDRYGLPTSATTEKVQTNAGAQFDAADVTWKGTKLTIRMYERLTKVDESHVVIADNAIQEAEMAAERAKRASEAQKF